MVGKVAMNKLLLKISYCSTIIIQQTFVLVKTYSRRLRRPETATVHDKTNNRLIISLDLGYVLHNCNTKNSLYIPMSTVVYMCP